MFNLNISKQQWIIFAIVMLLIWGSLLAFWWIQADNINRDPCSICAERAGSTVICTIKSGITDANKQYYPNGSTYTYIPGIPLGK